MMTATDFRVALAQLDIPQKRFAEMTGYRAETVSRWATGDQPVPRVAELVVELLRYKATMSPAGEAAE
jgi:DNA-binding transcriptional regulator YiaG